MRGLPARSKSKEFKSKKKLKKILIWGNFGALGGPLGPPGGNLEEFLGESFGPLITASSGFCFGSDPKQNPEDAAISGPKLHMVRPNGLNYVF